MNIKNTPIYESHLRADARMTEFAGWNLPIQYTGIIDEALHCRKSVSLFDTCHMGQFSFKGDIQKSGIENAFCFPISDIKIGRCRYGFILNGIGGIIDDLIVYRIAQDELMIVVNAATTENDFQTIGQDIGGGCEYKNISDITAKIDIQGPLSRDLMAERFGEHIRSIPYFGFIKMNIMGKDAIVSRTGYTGELGYEIYIDASAAAKLWDSLCGDSRVKPAGLGARDILRLEMGYCLYGSDIDDMTTPIEADLGVFVVTDKEYRGIRGILQQKEQGVPRIRAGFITHSRRSPRHGYKIFHDDVMSGEITSGTFSPTLNSGIGMGYIDTALAKPGTKVVLSDGRVSVDAEIAEFPLYKNGTVRNK
jgi:aminomethyltransferase